LSNRNLPKTLEIRFKSLRPKERRNAILGSSIFFALMLTASLAAPFGRRNYFRTTAYFHENPTVYWLTVSACLTVFLYLFGQMLFGWIWRSLSSKPAAVLDIEKISSWTDTGRQVILWQNVTNLSIHQPMATEPQRFYSITIENNRANVKNRFCPKIILDSDRMDFDPREVIQFIKEIRPNLLQQLVSST
jgi:hypothetical protein